jgi:antagonist of KipI
MNLIITRAGILDTLQDKGRFGFRHQGINTGGVMDQTAAAMANSLVGNDFDEAVIEMHFPASDFLFTQPTLIAIGGADFSATINGKAIPPLHPVLVNSQSVLQFKRAVSGARAYLAVRDGFSVSKWLNSYSTNLQIAAGGYHGSRLLLNDRLSYNYFEQAEALLVQKDFMVLPWFASNADEYMFNDPLLVLPGNEWDHLSVSSQKIFTEQPFTISQQADRMGYQLKGAALTADNKNELFSTAVNFGTIQLLPNGQLIVLMADHQSTGGYPRIAHVISVHHSRLAQMKPGQNIRFKFTDLQMAETLLFNQQQDLQLLQNACKLKLEEYFE